MLSYRFCKTHQIALKSSDGGANYTLCYVKPISPAILQQIQQQFDTPLAFEQITEHELTHLLENMHHAHDSSTEAAVAALSEDIDLAGFREQFAQSIDLLDTDNDAPIIRLINAILTTAIKQQASDIHIESFEHRIAVRIRVDGVLQSLMEPPVELAPFLISRVKIMSGLDIAEKRLPQDGRISTQIAGRAVDIRVSTLPVANAERIVLRILDKAASSFTLTELAMPVPIKSNIVEQIHQPHGIFLVVGPTGSGKTTTLYAALSELDIAHKNIMTVEDPIEYFLDGVSQTQVNNKIGMNFAKGLRAILRQDPDIIMVGEIRDLETAEMAVQASLTGHLVLSTLHTNTATGAITRLQEMGIAPFLLSSTLGGVLSQRLVRKLCPHCKQTATATTLSTHLLGPTTPHYDAVGCKQCNYIGYRGRAGVYEFIQLDHKTRELIVQQASENAIESAVRLAFPSLLDNGLELVKSGTTTLNELMRVAAMSEPTGQYEEKQPTD
ncbi:GspE/PulE family protein [Ostreibacterium oceani]|uniref:General secretion pathway protein E n=1 Tax=Ostreibacterium oceani TaxID=2654998 RepID=A0A6N7EW67_9GAMM|nr:ATPase, T2SS/T4P/T4SS family [Ostreibacterium oceani]MPV85669.1 type II secretion system protein GspE [Ostreibacterium oceani]